MYVTRVYGRTTFGTFGRVRKRVCTQSTGYTRVTYAHIGYLFVCACVSLGLSNSPPFQIYLHNYGIVNSKHDAHFLLRPKESAKILSHKNVPASRHNLIRIRIANRYCVLLATLASEKATRMKWQTCSNGIYAPDTAF